jgi:DnaJ family protein C protein 9
LSVHPDKVLNNKEEATQKFQKLSLYYGILSDPKKRQCYDVTGSIQEAQDMFEKDNDVSWSDFFKQMFDIVDGKKIEDFKANYQCIYS